MLKWASASLFCFLIITNSQAGIKKDTRVGVLGLSICATRLYEIFIGLRLLSRIGLWSSLLPMDHAQCVCFRRLLGQLATCLFGLNPEALADLAGLNACSWVRVYLYGSSLYCS